MRFLLALLIGLALSSSASAQIFEVRFKTEKMAKKYAKYMVQIDGRVAFIGEIRTGVVYTPGKGTNFDRSQRSEWYLPNPDDPLSLPYKVKNGGIGKAVKKQVAGVQNAHIERILVFSAGNSFYSQSLEYQMRLDEITELKDRRDDLPKGDKFWQLAQLQLLEKYDRLYTWVGALGYTGAAKKIAKTMQKERKVVGKEASLVRKKRAMEGVGKSSPAVDVNKSAEKWAQGATFRTQQSQHCRITYFSGISDGQAARGLELAEEAILGFRQQFIDPYLAKDFKDRIPETRFVEWYFGPDDEFSFEHMFVEHYGMFWGADRVERLKVAGQSATRGGKHPTYLFYWRNDGDSDVVGRVANNLGVALASLHYGTEYTNGRMDWLEEALGYWVSLEFLGRNTVTNLGRDRPDDGGRTVSGKKEKDKKTVSERPLKVGERRLYLEMALAEGVPFSVLMTTRRFDMEAGDVAKSWSFFEFLTKTNPRQAQVFLRAMGQYALVPDTFHDLLRKKANLVYEIKDQDVFRWLEKSWQEYARAQVESAGG
jgi:hypothetical protein